ncbi:Arm DNA-binding domain-containing protein [Dechloromonas sp. ARDL1]|uniref:Arm DNA-binding domain-containing protein n=1 Tax=Dechloromonas sp. ARDL1 TaxID=3322121 RepID=UPI003DA733AB
MKPRKYSFETIIPFTVARLRQEAERVCEQGLEQVQFTSKTDPGLQAMIYGTGRIVFYSRYAYLRRPYRDWIGELGLISIDQARQKHHANRVLAAQGQNPRHPKTSPMLFKQLYWDHYVVQCQSRGKKTLHTDHSRYTHWIGPEFADMAVEDCRRAFKFDHLCALNFDQV